MTMQLSNNYRMGYILSLAFVSAMGGLLFGYDWVVIGGAKPFYELFFGISDIPSLQGWAMSSALVGCIFGAAFSGIISDKLGRKIPLLIAALLFILSAFGTGMVNSLYVFIIYRLIGGVGIGLASTISPMYIAEIAPAALRGRFVAINQLTIVVGILAAQIVNWLIAEPVPADASPMAILESWNGQTGWRWMFWAELVPAALFFVLMLLVPESPRFLAKQHRENEALQVLSKIGNNTYAQHEMENIRASFDAQSEKVPYRHLTTPTLRPVLWLGIVLAVFQQWCGINIIFNYAEEIFRSAGYSVGDMLFNIVITGSVNLAFTLVAMKTVDKWGRKSLMLLGSGGLAVVYVILGTTYYFQWNGLPVLLLVVAAISIYAMSLAPVTWVVLSEIFPNRVRGLAMSVATLSLWVASFILTYTFPLLNSALGAYGTFWGYSLICVMGFLFIKRKLPETKGKTLEQIEEKLAPATSREDIKKAKKLVYLLGILVLFTQCHEVTRVSNEKPNILLIITDDQGYADYGAYGGADDVNTPAMDRIAKSGIRFTNGYATSPICSPSRQGIITGSYPQRWGTYYYGGNIFPTSKVTLPKILQEEGYRTVKIGKTHYAQVLDNNSKVEDPTAHREFPLNHGYEEFMGFCAHRHDYFKLTEKDNWVEGQQDDLMSQFGPLWRNKRKENFQGYLTDIFADEAIKQVRRQGDERPFFMELSFNAVHHPIYQAPQRYLDKYGIEKFPEWDPSEESFIDYHARTCWRQEEDPVGRKRYLANLDCLDDNIGRVLDALEETGKLDNTVIVLVSDNGGSQNTYANNGKLKGHKYILQEGGIRTIFTLSWSGKLEGGTVIHEPVSHMDILPTLLRAAGSKAADTLRIDGKSLFPLVNGKGINHHDQLIWDTGNEWAIRKGDWKLHVVKQDNFYRSIHLPAGTYLYNLKEDESEQNNRAEESQGIVEQLSTDYDHWKQSLSL